MAIKNNDLVNAVGGFGEMFFKTLQSERERQDKLQQQQQQFEQQTREMNLLNAYRNKMYDLSAQNQAMDKEKTEFDIRSNYDEISPMPNAPLFPILQGGQAGGEMNKPFDGVMNPFDPNKFYAPKTEAVKSNLEGSYKNPSTGTYWKYDETNREGVDTKIPYDKSEGSTTNNINIPTPTEPYTDTKDLDTAWKDYQTYQDLDKNWQNLENKPKDKDGNVLTYQQIKQIKDSKMKEIENLSKDRAKKISEEYVGFNSVFNDLLRDPALKSAKDKDAYISRVMSGYPDEAIRQMKDLISKRVF